MPGRSSLFILLLALLPLAACDRGGAPDHPNVVLISVDTLRGDALNCYGYDEHVVSPAIDGLARDGVRFEQYITAAPWTTPAHMSLITSLYPSSHGIVQTFSNIVIKMRTGQGFNRLAAPRVTLAEVLRSNGYATAAFTAGLTLDPRIGFDQGFDRYETSMYKLDESNVGPVLEWVGARADEDRPFFLFFHTFETHAPYLCPDLLPDSMDGFETEYRAMTASMGTATVDATTHQDANTRIRRFLNDHDAWRPEVTRALYQGGVRSVDRWIGRLLDALREQGHYDDTLVVFVSDHGDEFADHDPQAIYDMHGHSMYDEIIRVPLIIKLPGQLHAGETVAGVVRGVDVMPTIVDVTGATVLRDEMQGESLRPMWETRGGGPRGRAAFVEASGLPSELKCVRTGRYKYVVQIPKASVLDRGRGFVPAKVARRQLFDLVADPGEQHDLLAGDPPPSIESVAASLDARLRAVASAQRPTTDRVQLDEETIRRLRALGYVE